MTDRDLDSLAALAVRLADAAAPVALRYFRTPVAVDAKADASPVTIADRECEATIRAMLAQEVPAHGIYGEEHGQERLDASHVWVIDPIDGTRAFISGRPLFGTLIGLWRDGRAVIGIIDCPALDERWIGVAGRPTRRIAGGRSATARVRACPDVAQSLLACCTPYMFKDRDSAAFDRLARQARSAIFGGDCYSYGQLASGFLDLVVEGSLKPYDYVALVPVIEGAGGRCTDWQGRQLTLASDGRVVAAGDARAHEAAMAVLAS